MERKPAHIVIPELLEGIVGAMAREYETMGRTDTFYMAMLIGKMAIGIETLKKMVIPEKHFKEVAEAVGKIAERCPAAMHNKIFLGWSVSPDIIPAPSEPAEPSHRPDEIPTAVAADQLPAEPDQTIANIIAGPAM